MESMSEATAGRSFLKLFHNFFAQFAVDLEPLLHAIVVRVVHVKNTLTISMVMVKACTGCDSMELSAMAVRPAPTMIERSSKMSSPG